MCKKCEEVHPYDRVREIFPNTPDDKCDWILWEKTGWPSFFTKFPEDLYRQLKKYKRSLEINRPICDACGKMRFRTQMGTTYCAKCEAQMKKEWEAE